ncbi:MAG: NAD(P)-binding domain-containing protein [bacterium]|nr:NAD(P)-binding domain-containing protein [bacterium]
MRTTEIALIGAGPIGIEMAVALKSAGIDYLHLEAGNIGSTMQWWAPGTVFFSSSDRIEIASLPLQNEHQGKTSREEYLSYLRTVVLHYKLEIETFTRVTEISRQTDGSFILQCRRSNHGVGGPEELTCNHPVEDHKELLHELLEPIAAKKLVLAIGDMHLPRMLNIPGENLPHVSHYLGEPHQFFAKRVFIVGGKNSAIEAAIRLARTGAHVTLCYRGNELDSKRIKFWLYPEIMSLIRKQKISFYNNATPVHIESSSTTIRQIDPSTKETADLKIDTDFVLLLTGYTQNPEIYRQLGISLSGEGNKPDFNPQTMETNIPGVYVIGTGSAGTQTAGSTEFIETSHVHVERIMAHLQGKNPPVAKLNPVPEREI